MQSETSRIHAVLGVLVLLLFTALVVALFAMMRGDPRLFGATVDLRVRMPERTGLKIGDPVEIDGIQVGSVRSIRRTIVENRTTFMVLAEVSSRAEPLSWLGKDSRARARTVNILGDTVLSIRGDPRGHGLPEDWVIPGDRTPGFDDILADMRTSIASVQRIVGSVEEALVTRDETGQPRAEVVARAVTDLTRSLAEITHSVNQRMPRVLEDVERTTGELRELVEALSGPPGRAGEAPALVLVLRNLVTATDNAASITSSVKDLFAEGVDAQVLAKLIEDLRSSAENLKTITRDIREITTKVRNFFGQ